MSVEDLAFMSVEAVTEVIGGLQLPEGPASELRKSQAMKLFRKAQVSGMEAGLPLPGAPLTQPPSTLAPAAAAPKAEEGPLLLKQAAFLDQASDATFPLLPPEHVRKLRAVYKDLFGDDPTTAARPTDEQLSALHARLKSGRVPFVDFAVFGPFDDHAAKLRKYSDQTFVGGVLQTRLLAGPASFSDWSSCFEVFEVAMVMLGAAKPGSMARYKEGIRQLWHTFGAWSVIERADVAMRSREWAIVRDDFENDRSPLWSSEKPWDAVIAQTAFGVVTGPRAHWWWLHVQAPLNQKGSSTDTLMRLEQRPTNMNPVYSKGSGSGAASSGGGQSQKGHANKSSGAKAGRDTSKEYCFPWNEGKCKSGSVCPNGRIHACKICGGNHKATDCSQKKNHNGGGKGGGKAGGNDGGGKRKRKAGSKGAAFKK